MGLSLKDFISPITTAATAGMGLLLEKHEDQRQLDQQQKLQDIQIQGQQQMGEFNQGLAKQMWDYTNYENQMKHIEAAGLNPALMYGMGGGGGVTANTPTGNVTGAQAPSGTGHEIQDMAGMGLQIAAQTQLIQSQIEVNKSIANKNNTDATKTGGVDTTAAWQSIEQMKTQITNTEAQTQLTKANTAIAGITKTIQESSMTDQIKQIDLNAQATQQSVFQLQNNTQISDETKETAIKTIQQNYINAIIQGNLMKSNINVNNEQIQKMAQDIQQGWAQVNIGTIRNQIENMVKTSSAQLMDKEKSLLTAQTIFQGIGAIMNGAQKAHQISQ